MKIAVIGAGIIGITTAYELACDGHEVTVLERRGAAAEETSFANAGILAPGYITPWAAPDMPAKVMQHLFSQHPLVKVGLPLTTRELSWMWRWYRACKQASYLKYRTRLQHLAFYSRERLHQITADMKLDYERSNGYLVLLRSEKDNQKIQPGLQVLQEAGVAFKEVTPLEARQIESALSGETPLFGAVYLAEDEVGNCRQFALLLKNEALRMGVNFAFNTTVTKITSSAGIMLELADDPQPRQFDAAVLCAGLDSTRLLDALHQPLPIAAIHGYSVTATLREPLNAPRSAVMDEHYQVTISRMGNRVRVAGSAEIGGVPDYKRRPALQTLYKVLSDWFPGAVNLSSGVQEWKGTRAMLPDGLPIFGASHIAGLWLNLGHGAHGWTLSAGSARALADLMRGRTPDLDVSDFGIGRLHT